MEYEGRKRKEEVEVPIELHCQFVLRVGRDGAQAGEYADDVPINKWGSYTECDRSDGTCSVVSYARYLFQSLNSSRKHPVMFLHQRLGALMKKASATIVTQPGPGLVDLLKGCICEI